MSRDLRTEARAGIAASVVRATLTLAGAMTLGACSGAAGVLPDSAAGDAARGDALPSGDAEPDQSSGAREPDASGAYDAKESPDGSGWTDTADIVPIPDASEPIADASESIPDAEQGDVVLAGDAAVDVPVSGDSGMGSGQDASAIPIAFVQIATATVKGTPHVATTFLEPARAGDLIVVAVGTTDTGAMVNSVSDTAGNSYALAVGPTIQATNLAQYLFYARNIAAASAGAHKVTVMYNAISTSSDVVDMRTAEYSGLSTVAPLDRTAEATGDSANAGCGPVTTTSPRELLFAAGMSLNSFANPGTGFDLRAISSDGDLAEDQVVAKTGSISAGAQLQSSGAWVIQLAAFR